jgi:threonine dehydrogenase-like Zn-dependent dehydrogenase
MRAAVLRGPRRVTVTEVPIPAPRHGEVRIRLEGCGLCGANLPVWEGRPWFHYPLEPGAPGHEGWGVVEALGPGATGVAAGDRVAFLSGHALAEYDVAEARSLVRLPPALDGQPVPGEPLGCAMNVFRRSAVQAGQTVAVIGVGFLGALLTALAHAAGARVVAVSRRGFALEVARRMGADETVAFAEVGAAARRVMELTGGAGCERVIEASFYGTDGALALHNMGGSFYDFRTTRMRGTTTEVLDEEGEGWGVRAAVAFAAALARSRAYDPAVEPLLCVADVIDRIYAARG